MSTIKRTSRKELTATEILDVLDDGGRVVIEVSVLGMTTNVVIRKHEGTYYCDTPMKLLTHDSREELRNCLEQFRLAKRESEVEPEPASVTP